MKQCLENKGQKLQLQRMCIKRICSESGFGNFGKSCNYVSLSTPLYPFFCFMMEPKKICTKFGHSKNECVTLTCHCHYYIISFLPFAEPLTKVFELHSLQLEVKSNPTHHLSEDLS